MAVTINGSTGVGYADNIKHKLGTGDDLEIYHDGSNSYIKDVGTGQLDISSDKVWISGSNNESMADLTENGAVQLYYDNSKKAETVTGGFTVTGTCTATAFAGDGSALTGLAGVPSGVIVMWNSTVASIPTGWVLCDGNNSTPDLRDRFIVGAKQDDSSVAKTNVSGALTQTGGAATHTLSEAEMPQHNHHFQITTDSSGPYGSAYAAGNGSGQGWIAGAAKGSSNAHNNLPPYYALCFIMKS